MPFVAILPNLYEDALSLHFVYGRSCLPSNMKPLARRVVPFVAVALALSVPRANAQTLYGETYTGVSPNSSEQIVGLSPSNGSFLTPAAATLHSGSAFFVPVLGTAYDPVGHTYFTYGSTTSGSGYSLFAANTQTGIVTSSSTVAALASNLQFDISARTLYGTLPAQFNSFGVLLLPPQVVSIDISTGAFTRIAFIGGDSIPLAGAAYDQTGHQYILYGTSTQGERCASGVETDSCLFTVSTQTGAVSAAPALSVALNLQFDSSTYPGTLYGETYTGTSPAGSEQLVSINRATGAFNTVATIRSGSAFSVPVAGTAYDPTGTIYFTYGNPCPSGTGNCLFSVNTTTRSVSSVPVAAMAENLQFGLRPSCPVNVTLAFGAATGLGPEYVTATFKAPSGTLTSYAQACGFQEFTWQQLVTNWPCPGVLKANSASVAPQNLCPDGSLTASSQYPFFDPPKGGYTSPSSDASNTDNAYSFPFYYPSLFNPNPNLLNPGQCSTLTGTCPSPYPYIVDLSGTTLSFVDDPTHTTLPGDPPSANPASGHYVSFSTSLVGITTNPSGTLLSVTPLKTWTWNSTFSGTAGGAVQASVIYPIDPGSGSGGVTITSINAVRLTIVPSTQIATTASGLAYSRVSQTFNGTVKITNIGDSSINAPSNGFFQILFTSLPKGVTLSNTAGTFNGSPYITVPAVASLAPGQSVTIDVHFKNPSNVTINFKPVIYSGSF